MTTHLVTFLVDGDDQAVRAIAEKVQDLVEFEWACGSSVQLVRGPRILAGEAVDDVVGEM